MISQMRTPGVGIGRGRGVLNVANANISVGVSEIKPTIMALKTVDKENYDDYNAAEKIVENINMSGSTLLVQCETESNVYEDRPPRVSYVPDDNSDEYSLPIDRGAHFDKVIEARVRVTGREAPNPITSIDDIDLPEFMRANAASLGYSRLTAVQRFVVPILAAGRDVLACAETGSGKTAAFLLPSIAKIDRADDDSGGRNAPRCIVIAPTRELTRQTFVAACQLCRPPVAGSGKVVRCAYGYGGVEMRASLQKVVACDLLCVTPGRLAQYINGSVVCLDRLDHLVLDEADRLLGNEHFLEVVMLVLKVGREICQRNFQVSLFSATFPRTIQSLAQTILKDYLFVAVGAIGAANSDIHQSVIATTASTKLEQALQYIREHKLGRTLLFVRRKRLADFYGIRLIEMGLSVTTIHGDRLQIDREAALNDFKSDRVQVLVATDVASRGLDIPHVDTVLNVDMPSDVDVYVHRIGRSGRLGNPGAAVTFFDVDEDRWMAPRLVHVLKVSGQACPPFLVDLASSGSTSHSRANTRDMRTVLEPHVAFMNQAPDSEGEDQEHSPL